VEYQSSTNANGKTIQKMTLVCYWQERPSCSGSERKQFVNFEEKDVTEFVVTYRGTVYPWHCDHMGHMNVMWYVGKFDEASWQLLSEVGLTRARFKRDCSGMAAVEQHIHYQRELHAGDVVSVRSKILEVREKSIRMRHELWNDETSEIAAVTETTAVHIDATARKARQLPADVRERVLSLFSGENDVERDDSGVTLLEECN